MYDPAVGRWLTQDPDGFDAGDPNHYRYVRNSPTNANDPSGLQEINFAGPLMGDVRRVVGNSGPRNWNALIAELSQKILARGRS